jgi:putative glycosyltransferase (TIGR04372 family)
MAGQDIIWRQDPNLLKFDIEIFKKQKWDSQLQNLSDIDIADDVNVKCKEIIRSLGYKQKEFICIHAREGGYKKDFVNNPLNVNIKNYIGAIAEICKRGILVFRLGDSSMTKLPKIHNLIDYPFVDYKSSEMDIFLIKNCKFIICMGSGPFTTARYLFQKKMLFVNHAQFVVNLPFHKNSLAIFKQPFSKSKQRYLSIKEFLLTYKDISNKCLVYEDIEMKENNEQEILESTLEMLDKNKNNLPTKLQEEFRKYYFRKKEISLYD